MQNAKVVGDWSLGTFMVMPPTSRNVQAINIGI